MDRRRTNFPFYDQQWAPPAATGVSAPNKKIVAILLMSRPLLSEAINNCRSVAALFSYLLPLFIDGFFSKQPTESRRKHFPNNGQLSAFFVSVPVVPVPHGYLLSFKDPGCQSVPLKKRKIILPFNCVFHLLLSAGLLHDVHSSDISICWGTSLSQVNQSCFVCFKLDSKSAGRHVDYKNGNTKRAR